MKNPHRMWSIQPLCGVRTEHDQDMSWRAKQAAYEEEVSFWEKLEPHRIFGSPYRLRKRFV